MRMTKTIFHFIYQMLKIFFASNIKYQTNRRNSILMIPIEHIYKLLLLKKITNDWEDLDGKKQRERERKAARESIEIDKNKTKRQKKCY